MNSFAFRNFALTRPLPRAASISRFFRLGAGESNLPAVAAIFLTSLFAMLPAAKADVFYGDISGNSIGSGYSVGPTGGVNNAIAEGFTMTQSYNLTSVDLELGQFSTAAGSSLVLSIYSNNGSNNPGTDLYDLSTDVIGTNSPTPAEATFTGTGSFLLTAGTTYWLNLYASDPSSSTGNYVLWAGATGTAPAGSGATEVGQLRSIGSGNPPTGTPSTSELQTAYELNGTLVPEPSAVVLAAMSSFGLLALRRRRA